MLLTSKTTRKRPKNAQPTLQAVLDRRTDKYPRDSTRKQLLDDALVTFIAQDLQLLSVVSDTGFVKFCEVLDRRYQVPGRVHPCDVLLPKKFRAVQQSLKENIALVESVSITCDMWTSTNNSSFLALTCHWWNPKKEKLDSAILDCSRVMGRHTASMIQEELGKVLENFNIKNKILTFVTDNGSNIKKAIFDMGYRRQSCYAHSLNLIVTDAIRQVPEVLDVKEKVSRVVRLTRQSTVAKEKLDKIQSSLGMSPKKLIQDVPTRWNSFYEMIERFLQLKDAITLLLAQPGMDKDLPQFTASMWELISHSVKLLKPCYEATTELSGEKTSTGSKAIPLSKVLMAHYATAVRESADGTTQKKLAHKILDNLNERFGGLEEVRILAMATLLDPR